MFERFGNWWGGASRIRRSALCGTVGTVWFGAATLWEPAAWALALFVSLAFAIGISHAVLYLWEEE